MILQFLRSTYKSIAGLFAKNNYQPLRSERLSSPLHDEPIPYRNHFWKRSITYTGGLILGTFLYLFVYYVLIKHHTTFVILVALILMLAYLVVLENSHSIRSILMLCLPIMCTNRGRALVFCSMLAILVSGPIKNSQINVKELHSSLNCCKQYLIIKSDKFVDKNIVQGLVKVEDVIHKLVENIKSFAEEVYARFRLILQFAISVEQYISTAVDELKKIINICNSHNRDIYENCLYTFRYAHMDCKAKLGPKYDLLCEIVKPLKETCSTVRTPEVLCGIPAAIVSWLDKTIGKRLRNYLQIMENEFYFEVDVQHYYSYNGTKSKSNKRVFNEVKFDVEQKFWYIHLVARVFNLVSLILVVWILLTATLYHMHYLTELDYDNMYIDNNLKSIDRRNKSEKLEQIERVEHREPLIADDTSDSTSSDGSWHDDRQVSGADRKYLFPMLALQERKYLKPFSIYMNEAEKHKFYIAGFVWLIIIGYITFFVLLDYALYQLIHLVVSILDDILFKSDLPLVDISSKAGENQIVRYNRTYLAELRHREQQQLKQSALNLTNNYRNGTLSSMYRRLMDSIEKNTPDDVTILDSLQGCLPKPTEPNFGEYKLLLYLGLFTFGAVILEAYALRTRHCIANLYYPIRARKRAFWLYEKLIRERPKYENPEPLQEREDPTDRLLDLGVEALAARIKR